MESISGVGVVSQSCLVCTFSLSRWDLINILYGLTLDTRKAFTVFGEIEIISKLIF